MMRFNIGFYTLLLAFLQLNKIYCQEGNYRFENYGNRSILLNGNVTGSVEDLGLTYYNPARLAVVEKTAFAINAKAYQYTQVTLKDGFEDNQKLKDSEFGGIPSMVAGTFEIGFLKDEKFAYSFISKSRANTSIGFDSKIIDRDVLEEFEGDERFLARVNLNNSVKDEWFGVTWAKTVAGQLSIGISGFLSIYEFEGNDQIEYAALHSDDQVALYRNRVSFEQDSYGLFWKLGLAWKIKKMEVGLNINLPYMEVYKSGKFNYEEVLSGQGSNADRFVFNNFDAIEARRKLPLGIAMGAGFFVGKHKLHTNLEWYNKVSLYDRLTIPELTSETDTELSALKFDEKLKHIINWGFGAELYFGPKFSGYLSFSTDYSAFEANANLFDLINRSGNDINFSTDYNHLGMGVDIKSKWASIILGGTYSSGNSTFARPISFPSASVDETTNEVSSLKIARWRFIVGIDIPIINKKLEKLN